MKYLFLVLTIFFLSCADHTTRENETVNKIDSSLTHTDTLTNTVKTHTDTLTNSVKPTPQYRNSEIIEAIKFSHGSSTIKPADIELLKRLANICASDSLSYLKVFGFTDTVGPENENEKLAQKRAEAVFKYLDPKENLKNCVYVDWLGESGDIYDLHFPQAHYQQNAVDVWIMTRKKLN